MSYSRFFLCDLQVHSPADRRQRYGDVGSREPSLEFAMKLVQAHRNAGVEVIAVTDHNSLEWYPMIREAGDQAGVFVFPGLEFSVNGCHVLGIWDRTEEGTSLARLFLDSLWSPGDPKFDENGDPKPVSSGQVLDCAERAADHKGLVFAPHSTAKGMGLFASRVCRNSSEIAQSHLLAGFDVVGSSAAMF
jgi:hypothetical protein